VSTPLSEILTVIRPDWPVSARVQALVTTRSGGVSQSPWYSFNLATHVGDGAENVAGNRQRLSDLVGANKSFQWLNQTHGTDVVVASDNGVVQQADGAHTQEDNLVCTVLTADCLPVFFCNKEATQVAVAHAGWKGLGAGILEKTLACFSSAPEHLRVWLGPAIGSEHFEVGDDVRQCYIDHYPSLPCQDFFAPVQTDSSRGCWHMDIYAMARYILKQQGVGAVYGGDYCTYADKIRFFSYRREPVCGRMASCIWLEPSPI
jgi:YfiH family protein